MRPLKLSRTGSKVSSFYSLNYEKSSNAMFFLLLFGEFYRGVENFSIFFVSYFNFVFASESYHFDDKKSDRRLNFHVISKQNRENHKSENIILPLISAPKSAHPITFVCHLRELPLPWRSIL